MRRAQICLLTPITHLMYNTVAVSHCIGLKTILASRPSRTLSVRCAILLYGLWLTISVNRVDPFFSAAALHFDNLFERYGCPVYVLNLVKVRQIV